ncbi:AAA family ATPase [Saccharothrix australiensis]|uniref:MoxR-like ATPase n=1 Tax=Saccharothrix australiensis TaxID=2072 RepID=A0A495W271_9PSEU|nr:MoxR family ATPase [Saccharothrix australiensis]RKT55742.1 MoxR-like ATPase [Saccharothrix australiensis]
MTTHVTQAGEVYERIAANVQRVVRGKPEVVRLAVAALLCEGHLLFEDVPGIGKTTLARCLARSIGGTWNRIQFTPDLLPGDITGVQVYHQNDEKFVFHPGGVFANVVLADEINRGTPKTQSAMLEVMSERRVTVDAVRHEVPTPFLVIATQNPIEMAGTYRLPEAQLDRFLMRLRMGYPDLDAEVMVIISDRAGVDPDELPPVVDIPTLQNAVAQVRGIRIDTALVRYAATLTSATRQYSDVRYGASPRGSIALIRAAQGIAATHGREFVTADDIKQVAHPVLDHRLILTPDAELRQRTAEDVVRDLLAKIPVPVAGASGG